jgi:MFS family permease
VATYPMALLTQRFPTVKVVAGSIFAWSIVILCTPACNTYGALMVNRFFLGAAESCIAPTFTVYVTFWWTRREQALRSGLWYGVVSVSMMITPLISWGLGHIQGGFGASTWKYMYLVAGSVSMVWSFVVLWVLPGKLYLLTCGSHPYLQW